MLKFLNMFNVIGVILIGISIAGFVTHSHFLREPGQDLNPMAPILYLVGGLVMLVNGVLSVQYAPPEPDPAVSAKKA